MAVCWRGRRAWARASRHKARALLSTALGRARQSAASLCTRTQTHTASIGGNTDGLIGLLAEKGVCSPTPTPLHAPSHGAARVGRQAGLSDRREGGARVPDGSRSGLRAGRKTRKGSRRGRRKKEAALLRTGWEGRGRAGGSKAKQQSPAPGPGNLVAFPARGQAEPASQEEEEERRRVRGRPAPVAVETEESRVAKAALAAGPERQQGRRGKGWLGVSGGGGALGGWRERKARGERQRCPSSFSLTLWRPFAGKDSPLRLSPRRRRGQQGAPGRRHRAEEEGGGAAAAAAAFPSPLRGAGRGVAAAHGHLSGWLGHGFSARGAQREFPASSPRYPSACQGGQQRR